MERRKFIGNFRRNMSRVNEYSNIAELLDTKLRRLRFAQKEWNELWAD